MFGIVVQGAFRLKMHQNDFFPHFWHEYIKIIEKH
jgi:hypothetical protein